MLENLVYSVISPEGCASILWRDGKKAPQAAEALKLTAPDLIRLEVVDGIIDEPVGGAHRDPASVMISFSRVVTRHLDALSGVPGGELTDRRLARFRGMGVYRS